MSHKKIAHIDIQYDNNVKVNFRDVAVLPTPVDNCAICTRRIEKNTVVVYPNNTEFTLSHTILEGHRFCAQFIPKGSHLLSWGLPFGDALRDIHPGEYVCNASVLEQLHLRHLDFPLPSEPNFQDRLDNYQLPDVIPHHPLVPHPEKATFMGFPRGSRGVGTRNYIVILGLTSTCGSYARALLETVKSQYPEKLIKEKFKNVDGVVAISHTEGSSQQFNNFDFVMRTLCGWIVHSNVGAVIVAVDPMVKSPLNMESVTKYMKENNYPEHLPGHIQFLSLSDNFKSDITRGLSVVTTYFDLVNESQRQVCDVGSLKIALQCGGSDAFSGISANPLAAWTAKDIIRYGGCANLAETDELMGAEPYVVRNCRSRDVAEKFLKTVKWFREWAGWHGHNAEGNPSGGNKFRGLYNIALKSLGAAMKRNPDVPLGHVIDYSELMKEPGYYFMNSPGNDLESIAGQVASGCQIIFFTTGNGSITNFPFVPTIKIVTTTGRFNLLSKDMDFNAGEYLDGVPMDVLGKRLTDLTLQVAAGQLTCGERAGHSQVSIWRNWTQRDSSHLSELQQTPDLHSGQSLVTIATGPRDSTHHFRGIRTKKGVATDSVGLVLPTSLCSGQIARMITESLNSKLKEHNWPVSKFVALPHTEGCGSSGGSGEALYRRTVLGHLVNPVVHTGLLLEHGCEKTHNDYMSEHLKNMGVSTSDFGWASVQLDGGISKVTDKVISWFENKFAQEKNVKPSEEVVGLEHLRIALLSPYDSHVSPSAAKALAAIVRAAIENGGTVVIPSNSSLLKTNDFLQELDETCPIVAPVNPTISYGQIPNSKGLHVMSCPSDHWVETLTGLGATGIELMVGYIEAETEHQKTMQTHPMFPLVQITTETATSEDFDLKLQVAQVENWKEQVLDLILKTASREYVPKLKGNSDFQIARDVLQVSM